MLVHLLVFILDNVRICNDILVNFSDNVKDNLQEHIQDNVILSDNIVHDQLFWNDLLVNVIFAHDLQVNQ